MRKPFTTEDIEEIRTLLSNLIQLYEITCPNLGEVSKKDKTERAYQALNDLGILGAKLTEWAELHIFGICNKMAFEDKVYMDASNTDSHEHELISEDQVMLDVYANHPDFISSERAAIAIILKNLFGRYGRMGWRLSLSDSLYALNEGQVDDIFCPTPSERKGNPYSSDQIKWAAVKHVYLLRGGGWEKKSAAQHKVAEFCGVTYEAIRKWEATLTKERDPNKIHLKYLTAGVSECKQLIHSIAKSKSTYSPVVGDNIPLIELNPQLPEFAFQYLTLISEFPLESLGQKLLDEGVKKTGT